MGLSSEETMEKGQVGYFRRPENEKVRADNESVSFRVCDGTFDDAAVRPWHLIATFSWAAS